MFVLRHTVKLFAIHWKRFVIFLCLTALLCVATGLLGSFLLQQNNLLEPITLVVVDQDDSLESRLFFNAITSVDMYGEFLVFAKDNNYDSAMDRLQKGQATAVVVVPPGFAGSVLSGENQPVSIWYSASTPLKTQLVNTYADAFTEMLKTSQIGVYTALDYAREQGDVQQYNAMFLQSNMRYLRIVGERGRLFTLEELSATGQMGIFLYYLVHALVFLLLLSPVLLLEILRPTFTPFVMGTLHRMGTGTFKVGMGCFGAIYSLYLAAGLMLTGAFLGLRVLYPDMVRLPLAVIPALLILLLTVSAFALLMCVISHSTVAGGMLLSAVALVSLALSGGIIPTGYLAGWVQMAGRVTPHYWCAQLLSGACLGSIDPVSLLLSLAFGAAFFLAAVLLLRQQGKRGELQ